jgi:small subunit ribosomal protein S11
LAKQKAKAKQKQAEKPVQKKVRKRKQRVVPIGVAHVKATFNNTIVTITDLAGNVVAWASSGKCKFSGSKKSSAFAGTVVAQNAAKDAVALGMQECEVNLKGPGAGRESAVRGLQSAGLNITIIKDKTPVPHNGCRPRKRRRV